MAGGVLHKLTPDEVSQMKADQLAATPGTVEVDAMPPDAQPYGPPNPNARKLEPHEVASMKARNPDIGKPRKLGADEVAQMKAEMVPITAESKYGFSEVPFKTPQEKAIDDQVAKTMGKAGKPLDEVFKSPEPAGDSVPELGGGTTGSAVVDEIMSGAVGAAHDVEALARRAVLDNEGARQVHGVSDALEQAHENMPGQSEGEKFARRTVRGTTRSLLPMIPAGMVGGPVASIGLAGAMEASGAEAEAEELGMSGAEKAAYVGAQAAIETLPAAVFQKIGLGGAEDFLSRKVLSKEAFKSVAGYLARQTGAELTEENITELGHLTARALADPNVDLTTDAAFDTVLQTTAQTALTMGLLEPAGYTKAVEAARADLAKKQQHLQNVQKVQAVKGQQAFDAGIAAAEKDPGEFFQPESIAPRTPEQAQRAENAAAVRGAADHRRFKRDNQLFGAEPAPPAKPRPEPYRGGPAGVDPSYPLGGGQTPNAPTVEQNVPQPEPSKNPTLREIVTSEDTAQRKYHQLKRYAASQGITEKDAQELAEGELAAVLREITGDPNRSFDEKWREVQNLYNRQPRFSGRTSTSIANQAYSTPAPLAFLLGDVIGLDKANSVYEPTAGTGMLVTSARPQTVHANEINPLRLSILGNGGYSQVTNNDASTTDVAPDTYDAVIANPPFGKADPTDVDGYVMKKREHIIAARALNGMKSNGTAALILGANQQEGQINEGEKIFLNWLYNKFNVVDNIEVDGALYANQGASFPVRVILISGRKATPGTGWSSPSTVERVTSWADLRARREGWKNEIEAKRNSVEPPSGELGQHGDSEKGPATPDDAGSLSGPESGLPDTPGEGAQGSGETGGNGHSGKGPTQRPNGRGSRSGGRSGKGGRGGKGVGGNPAQSPAPSGGQSPVPVETGGKGTPEQTPGKGSGSGGASGPGGRMGSGSGGRSPVPVDPTQTLSPGDAARFAELQAKLQSKLGKQGPAKAAAFDAEAFTQLVEYGGLWVKAGVRKFEDWVRAVFNAIGDAVRPYLQQVYAGLRSNPELRQYRGEMDSADYVENLTEEEIDEILAPLEDDQQQDDDQQDDDRPPRRDRPERRELNENLYGYDPFSQSESLDTGIPKMMADSVEEALAQIEDEHGDIDQFVMNELGYETIEDLHEALAGEQVDGVAMAIHQIKRGRALVIGDQTGIGKGRQGAMMIRWALRNDIVPIFMTKEAKLFSDMYRDLRDTDSHTMVKPLLIGNQKESRLIDEDDNVVQDSLSPDAQQSILDEIIANGWKKTAEAHGFNTLFIPYSQIQHIGNVQQRALSAIIGEGRTLPIMDEAHELAGEESQRGAFMRGGQILVKVGNARRPLRLPGILRHENIVGALYSSATYAKRPSSMPLYFLTDISRAVRKLDDLIGIVKNGGVAMQQVIANALAKSGQYIRREKAFNGINVNNYTHALENTDDFIAKVDEQTEVMRMLVAFSRMVQLEIEAGNGPPMPIRYTANTSSRVNVADFASVVHNAVSQLLLASKADSVADMAIEKWNAGEKPIIVLVNTMESFINSYVEENNISAGDNFDGSFKNVLLRALNSTLKARLKHPDGTTEQITLNPADFQNPAILQAFQQIKRHIGSLDVDFPASPIDYIKWRLKKAGMNIGEITGRKTILNYRDDGKTATLAGRSPEEKGTKTQHVNAFNSGRYDGMVMNVSGSTGLSLHAHKKVKDQRKRHTIVAQPPLDIAVFMQILGRIVRSGMLPGTAEYTIFALPVEVERRPATVLTNKMKSLSANTTSNTKSNVDIKALEIFNKYGDKVVAGYLFDNPDLRRELHFAEPALTQNGDIAQPQEGYAQKVTGRLSLLPNAQQAKVYDEISALYTERIEYLKRIGSYDLEITAHDDWDAVEVDSAVIKPGTDNSSVFTSDVVLKKFNIKDTRVPPIPEEVWNDIESNFGGRSQQEINTAIGNIVSKLQAGIRTKMAEGKTSSDNIDRVVDAARTLSNLSVGRPVNITFKRDPDSDNTETIPGTVTRIQVNHDKTGYASPARMIVHFAMASPDQKMYFNMAEFARNDVSVAPMSGTIDDVFNNAKGTEGGRFNRYIWTGNVIGAADIAKQGRIVTFSTRDGEQVDGLLMPLTWDERRFANHDPRNQFTSGAAVGRYIASQWSGRYRNNKMVISSNDDVEIIYTGSWKDVRIAVPTGARGAQFHQDTGLTSITDDFVKRGNKMVVDFGTSDSTRERFEQAIDYMIENLDQVFTPDKPDRDNVQTANDGTERARYSARKVEPQAQGVRVSNPKKPKPEPTLEQRIQKEFPGALYTETVPGKEAVVTLPNGKPLLIQMVDGIEIDRDAMARGYGEAFRTAEVEVFGAVNFTFYDKSRLDGIAMLRLVSGKADKKTMKHERLHVARMLGLFTDAEWNSLVEKYGKPGVTDPLRQEELIAEGVENWSPPKRNEFWHRVKETIKKLIRGTFPDSDDIIASMEKEDFWSRNGTPKDATERYQMRVGGKSFTDTVDDFAAGKAQEAVGRPELANPGKTDEQREFVNLVDENRPTPPRETFAQWDAIADAMIQNDRQGTIDEIIQAGEGGIVPSGDQEAVYVRAGMQLSRELIDDTYAGDLSTPEGRETALNAVRFVNAYRQMRTEQGRALAAGRDPLATPADRLWAIVDNTLLGGSERTQRRIRNILDRLRQRGLLPRERARLLKAYEKALNQQLVEIHRIWKHLQESGIDTDDIQGELEDPRKAAWVDREISTLTSGNWDKLKELRQNELLSALITHIRNTTGNMASITWDFTAQRLAEAMVNLVVRDEGSAQFGEFKYIIKGMAPGFVRGLRNGVNAWRFEKPMFEDEIKAAQGTSAGARPDLNRGPAIKGVLGQAVRFFGYRPLTAMDEFFKSLVAEMEAGAVAYREAKAQGLTGDAIAQYVRDQVSDLGSTAWAAAHEKAIELTFQEQPQTDFGKYAMKAWDAGKLWIFFPFMQTPLNLLRVGIRKSPLGVIALAKRLATNAPTYSTQDKVKHSAEQLLAYSVVAALGYALGLFDDEDDDKPPLITGSLPWNPADAGRREATYRAGIQPMSIRVGDTYYSYASVEPLATMLAMTVDGLNAYKREQDGQARDKNAQMVFRQFVAMSMEKTYMKGLSDIIEAVQDPTKAPDWIGAFATSWVPNILRSTPRAADPYIRETRVWGETEEERNVRLLDRLKYQAFPHPDNAPPARVDVWGRPVEKHDYKGGPASDFLFRVVNPFNPMQMEDPAQFTSQLDRMILNWNNQNYDDPQWPSKPDPYVQFGGKRFYMTEQEYSDYLTIRGQAAVELLTQYGQNLNFDKPSRQDIDLVQKALSIGQQQARQMYVQELYNRGTLQQKLTLPATRAANQ